jgi:threonine 3-dehydrogenase
VDFRSVRFPGLISALTVPSGGTSDYAPEMMHAAARGEPYACFVRPDTRIPFMAMPDGVEALLQLASVAPGSLTRTAYNVSAFNPSADEIRAVVARSFPAAQISWDVDTKRQSIVDSWPTDVDVSAARRDWGFAPRYDFDTAFNDYLIPKIKERYA